MFRATVPRYLPCLLRNVPTALLCALEKNTWANTRWPNNRADATKPLKHFLCTRDLRAHTCHGGIEAVLQNESTMEICLISAEIGNLAGETITWWSSAFCFRDSPLKRALVEPPSPSSSLKNSFLRDTGQKYHVAGAATSDHTGSCHAKCQTMPCHVRPCVT